MQRHDRVRGVDGVFANRVDEESFSAASDLASRSNCVSR